MPTMRGTAVVQRPPQEVFDYLADIGRHGEWSPKAWRVEREPGRAQLGTRFVSYGWIPGDKEHRNEVEVTEFDPPNRISWETTEQGLPDRFVSSFALTPEGSGTRVERIFTFPKPRGFVALIFPLISAAIVRPNFNKGIALLEQRLGS